MLICLLAILSSAGSLLVSRQLIASMTLVETGAGLDLADARSIQLSGVRSIASCQSYLLGGGGNSTKASRAANDNLIEQVSRLRRRTTDPVGLNLLDSLRIQATIHRQAFEHALSTAPRGPASGQETSRLQVVQEGRELDRLLQAVLSHFQQARLQLLAGSRSGVDSAQGRLMLVAAMTIGLLVLLCLLLIVGLGRSYRYQSEARSEAEIGETAARDSLTEVEAASHLKDEFLATVSHELRNPLAPILTWTQLLRSGTLDEEKTARALEVIERNVISQSQLIDDLVDVSRVVSGKFRLDVRPIDLVPVIRAAADSQGPASDAKGIRIHMVLDERGGLISGDSERIQQVMWNLISNAIKFTPKGGHVEVVLQRVASHIELVVSDSGIGIDAAFLPHVFEPFRQATGGSMRRHGGLGLGLSIVRHIVELHGGEILVESPGLNQGSKFTVRFPLLATARPTVVNPVRHPVARDSVVEVELQRLDGVRVLVVDDEPNASEALMVLFQSCGADACFAGSAAEALLLFESWRPDILVSDIAMPGEDGYSLIRKVRARGPQRGGTIPAVALTAYAKVEDRVSILSAGFQMYLSKPADPTELVAVVASLAKHREA